MNQSKLTRQAIGLTLGLGLEFLLGMAANLFVSFPDTTNEEQLWNFAGSQALIVTHIVVGTLLVLGALMLVVSAWRAKQLVWKVGSGIGFGAMLLAWVSGREFVASQSDGASFAMAIFFLIAALAYVATLYSTMSKPSAKA